MNCKRFALALLLAAAVVSIGVASAAPPYQYSTIPGSQCAVAGLNGGDPNHQFATQATGSYNRSTSSSMFVICPFVITPTPIEGGAIVDMNLSAFVVDNQPRDMTCTAVIGSLNRPTQPVYSVKVATISGPSPYEPTVITWTPADFGGASPTGGIVGSAWGTITCLLPPQTAIALMYAKQNPTIDN